MIEISNCNICGLEAAIRGMRNPKNSWNLSDSYILRNAVDKELIELVDDKELINALTDDETFKYIESNYRLGPKDLDLAKRLASGGPVHGKFKRMMVVYIDILAPFYWWKEFDTYKVGTVADSCSTMHKIQAKEFVLDDFSHEHLLSMTDICPNGGAAILNADPVIETDEGSYWSPRGVLKMQILMLNKCRLLYLQTNDKKYWWQMIQLLPSSYNQKRTVMLNYEVLTNIYHSRKDHKLDEWHTFCDWIETLPYSVLITGKDEE